MQFTTLSECLLLWNNQLYFYQNVYVCAAKKYQLFFAGLFYTKISN